MRIGAALERLLSPQESGDDGETGGADGAGAFRAEIDAAVARERARRTPRADDHAAAIVLDPRLVLSLQGPHETATPAESIDARDTRGEARDSSAMDSAQPSKGSQAVGQGEAEAEARGETEATEHGQSPSGGERAEQSELKARGEAASDSRVEPPHVEDEEVIESRWIRERIGSRAGAESGRRSRDRFRTRGAERRARSGERDCVGR